MEWNAKEERRMKRLEKKLEKEPRKTLRNAITKLRLRYEKLFNAVCGRESFENNYFFEDVREARNGERRQGWLFQVCVVIVKAPICRRIC